MTPKKSEFFTVGECQQIVADLLSADKDYSSTSIEIVARHLEFAITDVLTSTSLDSLKLSIGEANLENYFRKDASGNYVYITYLVEPSEEFVLDVIPHPLAQAVIYYVASYVTLKLELQNSFAKKAKNICINYSGYIK